MAIVPKIKALAHPTDYTVYIWDKPDSWTRIGQFPEAHYAEGFCESIKSFITTIVKPARREFDRSPFLYNGYPITPLRVLTNDYKRAPVGERVCPEGWDA
jgi:hypothetical protein